MSKPIPIANPLQGGKQYTSIDRAEYFVHRGMAVMRNGQLHFTLDNQRERDAQQEFLRNRGGVLFWNGTRHPGLMHKPGEVRS